MVIATVIGARGSTSVNIISLRHILIGLGILVLIAVVNGMNGTSPHLWR
jgi:ABC-type lipoprotein release transport system permease subunit